MIASGSALEPGATLDGRYEILTRLGDGGFGAVYKARQRATGQAVALKIMRLPEHDDGAQREKALARFLRETRLCAELHHPNIVQLIDAGQTEAGVLYMVFSYAPGEHLAHVLAEEGALAPAEARHLMLEVLDALACAHAQGVVHRDLKPHNIMVVPTGARRNAVVLDFGSGAIAEERREGAKTRPAAASEILGTPGYVAPEQWRGLEPTPRADLFAWGIVFLECLTGKPTFGDGPATEILARQLSSEPVPIPPPLDRHPLGEILRAATRKDVAARDVTAAGLLAALEACDLRGLPRRSLLGGGSGERDDPAGSSIGASASPAGAPAPSAPQGERRQLTAVCCTLSALAESQEALPVEGHDELVRAAIAICVDQARRHRGHVAATLGDQLLLHFGYPRAEEDDARRAARAALGITAAIAADNERLAGRAARVDVRIGIHTGLVVAGDPREPAGAGVQVGATPRLAVTLAAEARPGGIAVSPEAQRLLRASFELEEERRALDGNAGPLKIFLLEREHLDRAPAPAVDGRSAALVGRDRELGLLLERWRRARGGSGQCSLVTGEPGIGKSRLGRELLDRLANESHTFLDGRCAPDTQNSALSSVIDLLSRALELDREPAPADRIARLETLLPRHGLTLAEAMPLFLPLFSLPLREPYAPLDVSPEKRKELTLSAILSLLFALAEVRPVLLLMEDLHWADPTTLELLTRLVREAPSVPIYLFFTARPEFSPSFPMSGVHELHLSRLEPPQIEAMAREVMGGKALPPAVLEQIARRTDGVPLFVEELTRMMVESGLLEEHGDRYELARPLADVEIPGTLRALISARLDRLGPAKETAQLAATLGREFSVEVLSAVSPLDVPVVQEHLDRLLWAELLFRRRRTKEPSYVFKHALVRDAAYESLSGGARRELHGRIARTLEATFPERVEERPDLMAHHWGGADRPEKAVGYWERAAKKAGTASAHVEALRHIEQGLAAVRALPPGQQRNDQEIDFLLAKGGILINKRGFGDPEVEEVFTRTTSLALPGEASNERVFTARRGLWDFMHIRGSLRKALSLGHELLALAEQAGEPALLLGAHEAVCQSNFCIGRFAQAVEHSRRSNAIYVFERDRHLATAYGDDPFLASLSFEALSELCRGRLDLALARKDEGLKLARRLNYPSLLAGMHGQASWLHLVLGSVGTLKPSVGEALGHAQRTIGIAVQHGYPFWEAYGRMLHASARAVAGDQEAASHLRDGIEIHRMAGAALGRGWNLSYLGLAHQRRGEFAEARRALDEAIEHCERCEERHFEPEAYRLRAELLLDPANPDRSEADAERDLHRAIESALDLGGRLYELGALLSLHRLRNRRGDMEGVRAEISASLAAITPGNATAPVLREASEMASGRS